VPKEGLYWGLALMCPRQPKPPRPAGRVVRGGLHVVFRRSDHAHALISRISTAAAAAMPGIFAIYTAQDLHDLVAPVRVSSRLN
jgi:CO/xanthine dehydrogenase Mo-binding subunit